jgi:hypothetical protein
MIKKRGHRIAIAVGSLGVTAGLMVIALPLVSQVGADIDNAALSEMGMRAGPVLPHQMRYGAMAYAPSGAWGRSHGQISPALANQAAVEACGDPDCKAIIAFIFCGAVAYDGSTYLGGSGGTRSEAEADALNRLPGGKIVNWMCQGHH